MRKKSAQHTYGFALFIGALIVLLILVACALKIFFVFEKSVFDGKQQFVLEEKEPGALRFFVFTPQDQSLHTLMLSGSISSDPVLTLGIPVDATISENSDISSFSTLATMLLLHKDAVHASTTLIDGLNLFIFVHTADATKTINQSGSIEHISDETALLNKVFTDPTIYKEGESIAIVNGTGISGLGGKVAALLSHMGANVVSVNTADTPVPNSSINYTGNLSYTLTRIAHVLGLSTVRLSKATISDITVVLGEDKANSFEKN